MIIFFMGLVLMICYIITFIFGLYMLSILCLGLVFWGIRLLVKDYAPKTINKNKVRGKLYRRAR